jgi:predicted RNA-binding Zn-ribbon protein involved in translation (DUF1610 family)
MEKIEQAVAKGTKPLSDRLDTLEGKKARPQIGQSWKVYDPGDMASNVNVECPSCGFHDPMQKIPVTTEKIVEKVVEHVPEGYIKSPTSWKEIEPILLMKHEDGKSIFDCPNCSTGFQKLAETNGYRKVK